MTSPRDLCLRAIRWYQRVLSPRKPYPTCKYYPSCSAYAYTAIERFGVIRGGLLAAWRLLRCNPFSKGGVDYVPEKKEKPGRRPGADDERPQ